MDNDKPITPPTLDRFYETHAENKQVQELFALMLDIAEARDGMRVAGIDRLYGGHAGAFLAAANSRGIKTDLIARGSRMRRSLSSHPEHMTVVDLDGDAQLDVLVGFGPNVLATRLMGMRAVREDTFKGTYYNHLGWNAVEEAVSALAPGGRAVLAVPTMVLGGYVDAQARRDFLERGLVEAIIELNGGFIEERTKVPVSVMVLSRGNAEVAFVDATSSATLDGISLEGAQRVPVSEIVGHCSILRPMLWNGGACLRRFEPLGALATRITRGTTLKAGELGASQDIGEPLCEDNRYLSVANLEQLSAVGEIVSGAGLDLMGAIPQNQERYLANDGDLVINKMGPYAVAMIRTDHEKMRVLPSGNLFVVTLDDRTIMPEFALAYLMGEDGGFQLRMAAYGRSTPSITKERLAKIMVPVDAMELQQQVVDELGRMRDEYHDLERRMMEIRGAYRLLAV